MHKINTIKNIEIIIFEELFFLLFKKFFERYRVLIKQSPITTAKKEPRDCAAKMIIKLKQKKAMLSKICFLVRI